MSERYDWVPLLEAYSPEMHGLHGNETDPAEARVVSLEVRFPGDRVAYFSGYLPAAAAARVSLLCALALPVGNSIVIRAVRLCDGTRTVTFPAAVLFSAIVSISEATEWMPGSQEEQVRALRRVTDEAKQNAANSALLVRRD